VVAKGEAQESRQKPLPPFITSRCNRARGATTRGFSVTRHHGDRPGALEGKEIGGRGQIGLITYRRTDSTRVADEADHRRPASTSAHYGADSFPRSPPSNSSRTAQTPTRVGAIRLPASTSAGRVRDFLMTIIQLLQA